ncbi:hypothetical protein PENSUB_11620 [Penicillium subrubescens]|uniref:Uncharacterized protein n=1 Tax=Penicillium subrubescens TaxID=1316194 RepID=A0A1Q5T277_9EURO|nr:hypothetical protein PENSUB_11620 [Penicillium subrubescens]
MLLLKAECLFSLDDINASDSCNDFGKRRSIFINELANRRRRLWALAQASVPVDQLPVIKDGTLLNAYAGLVLDALVTHKKNAFPSLQVGVDNRGRSVYHFLETIDAIEATYNVGFHDIDIVDSFGLTPLMTVDFKPKLLTSMKRLAWFISKGANSHPRLRNQTQQWFISST